MGIHYDRQRLTPPLPGKTHTGKHILHTPHKTALFHGEPISPRAHLAKKPARFFHSSKPFQRRLRTALRFLLRNGWPQAPVFSRRPEHKRKFRRAARLKDVFTRKYVSAAHNSPSSFLRRPYQNEFQRWYLPPRALPSAPRRGRKLYAPPGLPDDRLRCPPFAERRPCCPPEPWKNRLPQKRAAGRA